MKRTRKPWSAAQNRRLAEIFPRMTLAKICVAMRRTQASIKCALKRLGLRRGTHKPWTLAQLAELRKLYPYKATRAVATAVGRPISSVHAKAASLGLGKSAAFFASPEAYRLTGAVGAGYRFKKGHVPANKGLRRPGWYAGRMRETQFKKGQQNPRWKNNYPVGALRINADGYIDMKIREGLRAWRQLHLILWEDAHGPVPKHFVVRFKNGDPLDVELVNLELISRGDNLRRNSIHNLPPELKLSMQLLGQLKRRIDEKQASRSA